MDSNAREHPQISATESHRGSRRPAFGFRLHSAWTGIQRAGQGSVARNTLLLSGNTAVIGGGGILFWFIAARTLTSASVGVATAGTSLIVLIAQVGQWGLGVGLIRYSRSLGAHRIRRISAIFAATMVTSLCMAIPLGAITPHLAPGLHPMFGSTADIVIFAGSCVAWGLSLQYDNYLMSREFMGLVLLKNSVIAVTRVLAVVMLPVSSVPLLLAITGVSGVVGVLSVALLALRRKFSVDGSSAAPVTWRNLVGYSLWNHLSGLAGIAPPLLVPALVVNFAGATQAGAYYLAWSLLTVLQMIPSALSWSLFTHGAWHGHLKSQFVSSLRRNSDLAILVLALFFLPAGLGVLYLFGKQYFVSGAVALILMTAGVCPYHRALLLMAQLRLTGSQRFLALIYAGSQLAFLALCVPLSILFGAAGSAAAWALGEWLLLGWLRKLDGPATAEIEPGVRHAPSSLTT